MNGIRYRTLALGIAMTASIAACAKKDDGSAADSAATSAVPAGSTVATTEDHKFGAVQKFILRDSADAPDTVDVQVADSAIIVNLNSSPATDTVLGKISNTGSKSEKRYGFKPQTKAEYFLYAKHVTSGMTGWYINERKTGKSEQLFAYGVFAQCDSTAHAPAKADVGFKACNKGGSKKASMKKASMKKASMMSAGMLGQLFQRALALIQDSAMSVKGGTDDPGWVACSTGCCTLGEPQFAT